MDESRFRVGYYYSKEEGTIAIDLDDLQKMLNTGHGYQKITKSRHSRFVTVAGRSRVNDDGVLVFVGEAGKLEIEPMHFAAAPRLVDIGEPRIRARRVPKKAGTDSSGRRDWVHLDEEAIERGRAFASGLRKKRGSRLGITWTWHPVPTPRVSKHAIATDEHSLILPYEWETITTSGGVKKDEETVTIALDDLQQILNAGYGSHEITPSRLSGSVSIIRRRLTSFREESRGMKEGESMDRRPIEYCYWVVPGQLLAGEYPMVKNDEAASRAKLADLTKAGVNTFIDLTQDGELSPYSQWLDSDRQTYYRFSIFDLDIPDSPETTAKILDTIDAHSAKGDVVYLHCWGGVGRTGTIVGCWLARHGYLGPTALERLAELWATCPKSAWKPSPDTEEQARYVRGWTEEEGEVV